MELTAAIGKDWADVLEGIPQEFIQLACIKYQRDEPRRKPTPGAIYQIARGLMPKPVMLPPRDLAVLLAERDKRTPEQIAASEAISARRREEAARIMAGLFTEKKISGAADA